MNSANARLVLVETATSAVALTVVIPTYHEARSMAMSAKVPFDFYIGNKKLPADCYTVALIHHRACNVLAQNGKDGVLLAAPRGNCAIALTGELVFNVYEQECYLSEVLWNVDESTLRPSSDVELPGQLAGRLLFMRSKNPIEQAAGDLQLELPVVSPCSVHYLFPDVALISESPIGVRKRLRNAVCRISS
jgi:hypothetical protein